MVYIILLVGSGFLVAYSAALYPLLLMFLVRFIRRDKASARSTRLRQVSLVVAAHNEEAVIEGKIRNTMAFDYMTTFLFKAPAFVSFAYMSRKVIRWLTPFLLILFWWCSLALADRQPFGILFWGLNLSMALAVAGLLGMSTNKLARGLAYLYPLNLALIVGYGRYLLGTQRGTWQRAQR